MKKAYIFAGAGSQFVGMGRELYDTNPEIRQMFEDANDILGYRLSDIMFYDKEQELDTIAHSLPALCLYYLACIRQMGDEFRPDCVSGHSAGCFLAIAAARCFDFEVAMRMMQDIANNHQAACKDQSYLLALCFSPDIPLIEFACKEAGAGKVWISHQNTPEQIVICGGRQETQSVIDYLRANGVKRIIKTNIQGAYHTPLFGGDIKKRHREIVYKYEFKDPICPIYFCNSINAQPTINGTEAKELIIELSSDPVNWTRTVRGMARDGVTEFIEVGENKILTNMIKRILK